ncbi:MAG: hypothetical protein F7B18_05090 [Desulfurococcales archaeon]|nr:hypothetical protein [Desulfurococcales archaeon]
MKTIAVDEQTWNKLRMLREKLKARSYDEVIQLLIETWKNTELDKVLSETQVPDDVVDDIDSLLSRKRRM